MVPSICSANQQTGFYMITAFIMKELNIPPSYSKVSPFDKKTCVPPFYTFSGTVSLLL